MLDEITDAPAGGGWGLPGRTTVADAGYGDITEFRLGLQTRGLPYVVAVKPATSAYPADAVPATAAYSGRGRPPTPRYRDDPTNLRPGAGGRAGRAAPGHLAPRFPQERAQPDRRDALAVPGTAGTTGQP